MDESTSKAGKVTQALSPVKLQKVKVGGSAEDESAGEERGGIWSIAREEVSPSISRCVPNHPHSKKVMKHALRQQAKRRRKNTTIAAGNSAPLPRPILVPPQGELEEELESRVRPSTMMEVLNSIPGFTMKPRKRSNKKLSPAAQLEQLQTREGSIDLETPDSILVQTNLRSLLNKFTFASLPPLYQCKLVQLLPHVDRTYHSDSTFRLSASGLNNEFFAKALQQWRERLAEGEFTPENQQKLKLEAEKEKSKLDPWKLKHFEPIWGESNTLALHTATSTASPTVVTSSEWTAPKSSLKTTIKVRQPTARLRTVGAVTRAVSSYRGKREAEDHDPEEQPKRSKSDASHTQTSATLSKHSPDFDKDETDYSSSSRNPIQVEFTIDGIVTASPVTSVSGIIPQNISTVEKCSMEVEAASELTCIIPSEEVFNAPPMEMKPEDLQGHDSDDFIYVDPSGDFNESENESSLADVSGGDKDSLLCEKDSLLCEKDSLLCPVPNASSSPTAAEDVPAHRSTESSSSPLSKSEEEKLAETSEPSTLMPSSPSGDSASLQEDSAVKSEESLPAQTIGSEGPAAENTVPPAELVEATSDKPSDTVDEMASSSTEPCGGNEAFFSNESDLPTVTPEKEDPEHHDPVIPTLDSNATNTESELTDVPPETSTNPSPPPKSDEDEVSKSPSPSNNQETQSVVQESEPLVPSENFPSDEKISESRAVAEIGEEPAQLVIDDANALSSPPGNIPEPGEQVISSPQGQNSAQQSSSSEKLDTIVAEGVDPLENASDWPEKTCSPPVNNENSGSRLTDDTLSDETDSSLKDTSPPALSESNAEQPAQDDSRHVESFEDSKNTTTSPPVAETSRELSETVPVSVESQVLPGANTVFEEESSGACPADLHAETEVPLEEPIKEEPCPAWDGADSSTDKFPSPKLEGGQEGEVSVIPMQEELEVRLEESPLPAPTCEWSDFDKSESSTNSQNLPNSVPYPGHVKLELEVTLTPEVDNQVSSTVESSGAVIAPTTIVCLPSVAAPPLPPVPAAAIPSVSSMVSSPALPYLALSTSTPVTAVRAIPAIPTKTNVKAGAPSRGSRSSSGKPPPGAVNLERSYQICQAVIQNSPNRDQLRSQLKPPPSTLLTKEGVKTGVLPSKGNRPGTQTTKPVRSHPAPPVLVKHVFTSSQGIPVTMAVLPPTNTTEAITRERFNGADSAVQNIQNIYNKQQTVDSCTCNLNAMVVCQKCGAFCHDDCISSSRLCLTCLIR